MSFPFHIKNRLTGAVLFTAELGAEFECKVDAVKLGAAVRIAVKAGANLADANLADAYLAGADLAGADLARANLARAYLADANLARANLAGANLAGAYLARAVDAIDAGTPNGWRAVGWRRNGVLRVRVGCRDFSIAEGRKYWRGKADRREVLAALDYIEAVARLREWKEAGQ